MNLQTKQNYEANGIIVKELSSPDPHFRTKTFIQVPGKRLLPYYDTFYQIPESLNEYDEFEMNVNALPAGRRYDCDAVIWDLTPGMESNASLVPWPIILGIAKLVIIIIGSILIINAIYRIFNPDYFPHPCGPEGSVTVINDCYKLVIEPDCHWYLFNSCAGPDENGDGRPDGQIEDEGEKPEPPKNYMELAVYAALAIGGVFILYALIKQSGSEKYYGEHPSKRPAPREGYLSRKWYGE